MCIMGEYEIVPSQFGLSLFLYYIEAQFQIQTRFRQKIPQSTDTLRKFFSKYFFIGFI